MDYIYFLTLLFSSDFENANYVSLNTLCFVFQVGDLLALDFANLQPSRIHDAN